MGAIAKTPMTRTEACQILNIEESDELATEPVDHIQIMERFEILFEKNSVDNGGSFYIRSKIFFAKEHLMQDWPAELNVSKFDETQDKASDENSEDKFKKADANQDGKVD